MTFSPTITLLTTAPLQVDTNVQAINYRAFLESLGPWAYLIKLLYYNATTLLQFTSPIQYKVYDMDGTLQAEVTSTPVTPQQYQPSMYLDLAEKFNKIIFAGSSQLNFNLLPSQTVVFMMYGKRVSNDDFLPGKSNFQQTAEQFGIDLFAAYTDILEP